VGGVAAADRYPEHVRKAFYDTLQRHADTLGVPLQDPAEHIPNTRAALAVSEWARAQSETALRAFRERAMEAWWARGEDIEAPGTIARLADEAGLDADGAVAAAVDERWLARVWAMREEASDRWVMSIPTVFLGKKPVIGCQPYEVFEAAALQAGAEAR
jgi:predicted DsbA family dithiol-disulfide isomerase